MVIVHRVMGSSSLSPRILLTKSALGSALAWSVDGLLTAPPDLSALHSFPVPSLIIGCNDNTWVDYKHSLATRPHGAPWFPADDKLLVSTPQPPTVNAILYNKIVLDATPDEQFHHSLA
jgi:hypothetical protein